MTFSTTRFEILSLPFELTTNDKKFFDEFLELNLALAAPGNGKLPQVQYSVIKTPNTSASEKMANSATAGPTDGHSTFLL